MIPVILILFIGGVLANKISIYVRRAINSKNLSLTLTIIFGAVFFVYALIDALYINLPGNVRDLVNIIVWAWFFIFVLLFFTYRRIVNEGNGENLQTGSIAPRKK